MWKFLSLWNSLESFILHSPPHNRSPGPASQRLSTWKANLYVMFWNNLVTQVSITLFSKPADNIFPAGGTTVNLRKVRDLFLWLGPGWYWLRCLFRLLMIDGGWEVSLALVSDVDFDVCLDFSEKSVWGLWLISVISNWHVQQAAKLDQLQTRKIHEIFKS